MKATTKASLWPGPQAMLVIILLGIIIISAARDCKKQAPLRGAGLSAEGVSKPTKQSYEVGKQEIKSARLPTESSNAPSREVRFRDTDQVESATGEFDAATPQKRQRFKVQRVVDGDTVALTTGEKLRYIGVDGFDTDYAK